jgi:hypothetical protein
MNLARAALITALLVPSFAVAQDIPGGPYAPAVLLFPSGPRTLALGNTGVASRDDDVLFFNPAQLAVARGMSASFERYSGSSGGGALSSVTRFNTGGIAVGMRMLNYDAPFGTFPIDRSPAPNAVFSAGTSAEADVGIAQVYKTVRFGGTAKYVEDQLGGERVERAAFDLGLARDFFRFYTVGLSVQNIGRAMKVPCALVVETAQDANCTTPSGAIVSNSTTSVELPLRTTLGASTSRSVGEFDIVATAAVSMLRANYVTPSGGVEAGYSWLDGYTIALRLGGRRPLPGESGLTAGAGFTMDRLSIDYALETLSNSRIGHRIGLRIR